MANKPAPKNWNDVQVAIATISMVTTLACWNMFAGPDRASALEREKENATIDPSSIANAISVATAVPLGNGKVYFGGAEPKQVVIVVQQRRSGGGGGGGGAVSDSAAGGGDVVAAPPASGGGGGGGGTGGS